MRKMKINLRKTLEYLFYLFVFLLPWQTRWLFQLNFLNGGFWEYGSYSIYGIETLLWLILILFFKWLVKEKGLKFRKFREYNLKKVTLLLAVYGLLFIAVLSVFWAQNSGLALYRFFKLLEGGALFFLILTFPFSFKKLSVAIVASGALQGMLSIWQVATQYVWSNKWLGMALHRPDILGDFVVETANSRWLRAYGSLPHPNILAGFLVIGLILCFYLWNQAENQKQKSWVVFCNFLILTGLFLTFSRAAWLAIIISLLVYWSISFRYQKENLKSFFKFTTYNLLLALILIMIFYQPFITRLEGEKRLEIKSITERFNYFQQAKTLIRDKWLSGVGLGNYTIAVHNFINSNLPAWDYQPAHSIYLLVFSELGIFGLIFFLGLLLVVGYLLFKDLNPVASAIFLAIIILGFFDHYLWSLDFGVILFWLALGLGVRLTKIE